MKKPVCSVCGAELAPGSADQTCARCLLELALKDSSDSADQTAQTSSPQRDLPERIGSYRILELLGEGGMGQVYRATDSRLKRDVALKFLPESMAQDETARRRFLREARSAAALDHPYICQIHEIGEVDGVDFIAMEYVSGQTLKEKLADGQLPISECLRIASEIAEALDKAQEKGIVHRDLKPSNIMLTSEGHVKLMDFGLAKRASGAQEDTQQVSVTKLTQEGATLGTVPYMSPEQLKGEEVDTRSDIFSFGIILYEMLAGVHPFIKPDSRATASSILQEEPAPIGLHRAGISPVIQYVVRKMQAKEPAKRYQLVREIHTDLVALQQDPDPEAVLPEQIQTTRPEKWQSLLPWLLLPLAVVATWFAAWQLMPEESPGAVPSARFAIPLPEEKRMVHGYRHGLALSRDGQKLAFVAGTPAPRGARSRQIYVHSLEQGTTRPIPGTEGATGPVFSPDGRWLAFVHSSSLKRVELDGGKPITLYESGNIYAGHGVDWGANEFLVFAESAARPLLRVPATGGEPEEITKLDQATVEMSHRLPRMLPGEKAVLLTALRYNNTGIDWKGAQIFVQLLDTGERKLLIEDGSDARYVPTGHLVFARRGRLMAAPFDLERLEVTGSAVQMLEGVNHSIYGGGTDAETGAAQFSISNTGTLSYAAGSVVPERQRTLVWVDRTGREEPLEVEPRSYRSVRFSRDGRQVLLSTIQAPSDIWLYDLQRKIMSQQTFEGNNSAAIWGPEPDQFTFTSDREGPLGLYVKRVDTGRELPAKRLPTQFDNYQRAGSWTPDGKDLAFRRYGPPLHLWILHREGKSESFSKTQSAGGYPEFSPDGRWLAHVSREPDPQVYVRPYPGPGRRVQISIESGLAPLWSRDGREIFFESARTDNKVFAVPVDGSKAVFKVGEPVELFGIRQGSSQPQGLVGFTIIRSWDIGPDGRFLFIKQPDEAARKAHDEKLYPGEIHVVLNWFEELKRLVPTDN